MTAWALLPGSFLRHLSAALLSGSFLLHLSVVLLSGAFLPHPSSVSVPASPMVSALALVLVLVSQQPYTPLAQSSRSLHWCKPYPSP